MEQKNVKAMVVVLEAVDCPACGNPMPKTLVDRVTHNPGNCAEYRATHVGAFACGCVDGPRHSFVRFLLDLLDGEHFIDGVQVLDVVVMHPENN